VHRIKIMHLQQAWPSDSPRISRNLRPCSDPAKSAGDSPDCCCTKHTAGRTDSWQWDGGLSCFSKIFELRVCLRRIAKVGRLKSMRGDERIKDGMFSLVSLEQGVPADHPLREVRRVIDTVLRSLRAELDSPYADSGRPSIASEYILRALLLQVFFFHSFRTVAGRAD
jgi:hypothetical protein